METAPETETETESVEEETLSVIGEREVVDGQMQSYLTGEWKDEEVVTRRPIAVMIPNNAQAMPQYGLSSASIIYEAPVEGRITRLMGIFEDFDELDHIGPREKQPGLFCIHRYGLSGHLLQTGDLRFPMWLS